MEIIKQNEKLKVHNINVFSDNVSNGVGKHGSLLPDSVRCLISGPSNCGKTNVVFNLLTDDNGLKFNNVYVFSKSLNQPKYRLLEKVLSQVSDVGYFKFTDNEEVIHPNDAKPYSVFIFDDVSCENQNNIRSYFAMGRHNNVDSIYIGQTYSKIPKQLIRDNANMLVIFKQDEKNLKHIYYDSVNMDMTFEKFKDICGKAWAEKYGFVVIDKERELNNGRYRIGFDSFVLLKNK